MKTRRRVGADRRPPCVRVNVAVGFGKPFSNCFHGAPPFVRGRVERTVVVVHFKSLKRSTTAGVLSRGSRVTIGGSVKRNGRFLPSIRRFDGADVPDGIRQTRGRFISVRSRDYALRRVPIVLTAAAVFRRSFQARYTPHPLAGEQPYAHVRDRKSSKTDTARCSRMSHGVYSFPRAIIVTGFVARLRRARSN